ncbi:MAG TPA: hypothetical protein VEH00_06925 [Steroidobacteraceae bacterium]|nr:hypothetical protein [Steroidobacteraceae bacterium]
MPLFVLLPAAAAKVSRYIALSFVTATAVVLVAAAIKTLWGFSAPITGGLIAGVLCVHLPALLFVRKYGREFDSEEELFFFVGTFFALWFYTVFLSIAAHILNHVGWSSLQVFTAVLNTGLELVLVAVMVFYSAPFVAWLLFLRADESPPNNRWRGP